MQYFATKLGQNDTQDIFASLSMKSLDGKQEMKEQGLLLELFIVS
jgi:hypothetical protein